jgi:hypothetical protein
MLYYLKPFTPYFPLHFVKGKTNALAARIAEVEATRELFDSFRANAESGCDVRAISYPVGNDNAARA